MDSRGRPFIGRERELEELRTALDDAVAGRGRLVLLVGEPGIGKSRTAEEVAALARERRAEVLLGRCYEDEGAPALWPWVQILRGYAGARGDADLGAALGTEAAEIAQIVPEMRIPADSITDSGASRTPIPSKTITRSEAT